MTDKYSPDSLQVFVFDGAPVRGEIVNIRDSWQAILARKDYPPAVKKLLGDLVAAGVLLCGTLKFNGSMIIQAQGNGAVRLLVLECNEHLVIRATAKLNEDIDLSTLPDDANLSDLINPDGQGRLVITLDPADRKPGQNPYQGIVALSDHGEPVTSIAQAITLYMRDSEQLETRLWLASDEDSCGGLLLQRLPNMGGQLKMDDEMAAEGWSRLQMLSDTVTNEELLSLEPKVLMNRLYLDESAHHGVRSFDERPIKFGCHCSRIKVADMLKMLGEEEVNSILLEKDAVETNCDFCGQIYIFDAVDCKQIFASPTIVDAVKQAPSSKH
ncbi:Hsp33 family molecular chaperone HslO [Polynucleobacter sp. AM-26B4]|uniref:Hsp33 family molecular chaperone HslO n=1 Tax=Polynucleobacter sp. AM-26B4 TaxID=2689103 RepID=UPI001C0AB51E|nr:Hsp33 family molecular chaperone HslO [Polynucleobacter sp. AM-26B4]MBU3584708.1 Hsp33 family molecular chaperone HslO [Polynucleobacter sp. AM-26B4]